MGPPLSSPFESLTDARSCSSPLDLVIVLIFVAIMSLIRFFGSTLYVINRYVEMIGSQIQRRLFARRKVGEQSKLRKREAGRGIGGSGPAKKEETQEKDFDDDHDDVDVALTETQSAYLRE